MAQLRIKQILKDKGITAKSLADSIIIDEKSGRTMIPQYLNNIINGGKGASLNTLQKIAEALNVPMSSLFADYVPQESNPHSFVCPKCGAKLNITINEDTQE